MLKQETTGFQRKLRLRLKLRLSLHSDPDSAHSHFAISFLEKLIRKSFFHFLLRAFFPESKPVAEVAARENNLSPRSRINLGEPLL